MDCSILIDLVDFSPQLIVVAPRVSVTSHLTWMEEEMRRNLHNRDAATGRHSYRKKNKTYTTVYLSPDCHLLSVGYALAAPETSHLLLRRLRPRASD